MNQSVELFQQAQRRIPGGVNSPVRAFHAVGGDPLFIQHAEGAYLTDADGKQYIDYVGSWGPMLLGHGHPAVLKAVQQQIPHGLSYGAPTQLEIELAETLCKLLPAMDQVRMVNSGTEATMTAIRIARGATGRDKIIKFIGCYHGHHDALLVSAGSGALTLGVPSSPGVPESFTQHTLLANFNDIASVEALFQQHGPDIAAIIVEPIAGNMNCIPPLPGFLASLRSICDKHGSLLIFDEVMTGFRVHAGGAQELYGITPDLTTLGKIIGGGMPVGAVGGKQHIMQQLAPVGPIYQAGTLSGNPIAMAAGLATLRTITELNPYAQLAETTGELLDTLQALAKQHSIPLTTQHVGSMFGLFFTDAEGPIHSFEQVMACNSELFKRFFHGMLTRGIYLAPSAFEAGFVSIAHGPAEIEATLTAAEQVFKEIAA